MANMRNRRMDDPDGVNSRIFVGNIPLDTDRETLKKKFETHGQVNGVMVLKGFAFLQFDKDIHARQAIEKENGSEFNGRKLDVKPAKNNNRGGGGGSGGGPSPWMEQGGGQQQQQQSQHQHQQQNSRGGGGGFGRGGRSGGDQGQRGRGGQRGGGFNGRGHHVGNSRGGFGRGGFNGPGHGGGVWAGEEEYGNEEFSEYSEQHDDMGDMERFNERLQAEDEVMGYGGQGGYDGGHRGGFNLPRGRGGSNFRGRGAWSNRGGGVLGGPPPQQGPPPPSEKPNDVEIICMDKSLRLYGENLEGRLKNMSLAVDILFPNPDIPVGKVLGNIASRGVMFAICLTPENRDHGSVTLNVLQGQQQEHRNMPVDDAMSFISKQFPSLVGGSGGAGGSSVISRESGHASHSGHPSDILKILSFLADDRPLSIMEYDKMIKYLITRRTDTLREEYGDSIPAHLYQPPVGPQQDPATKAKQEEIQNRVQKILKERKTSSVSKPGTGAMAPSLQAAIDSLVKNGPNLLSSVSQSHSGLASASSSFSNTMPGTSYHGYQTQSHSQDFTGGSGGFGAGFGNY